MSAHTCRTLDCDAPVDRAWAATLHHPVRHTPDFARNAEEILCGTR